MMVIVCIIVKVSRYVFSSLIRLCLFASCVNICLTALIGYTLSNFGYFVFVLSHYFKYFLLLKGGFLLLLLCFWC